jgi:hypothetical protein
MAVPTLISHLVDCEVLLVVAALLTALIPFAGELAAPPPAYSGTAKVYGNFSELFPEIGGLIALVAVILCFVYACLPEHYILEAAFAVLFLAVLIYFVLALGAMLFALKPPALTQQERISEQDKSDLTNFPQGM